MTQVYMEAREQGTHNDFRRLGRHKRNEHFYWYGSTYGKLLRARKLLDGTISSEDVDEFERWALDRGLQPRNRPVSSSALHLVSRGAWGANNSSGVTVDNWLDGVGVVVHHTADNGPTSNTEDAEARHMRAMQYFHQRVRGWSDIGYNYVIFPSGRVYIGRGFGVRGAHVLNHNTDTLGISFVGTYTTSQPTPAAVKAYNDLLAHLAEKGAKRKWIRGHGDLNPTTCPGNGVRLALGL